MCVFHRSSDQKAEGAGSRGRVAAPAQVGAAVPSAAVGRMLVGRDRVQPGRNPRHEQLQPVTVTSRLNHQSKRDRHYLKFHAWHAHSTNDVFLEMRQLAMRICKHFNAVFLSLPGSFWLWLRGGVESTMSKAIRWIWSKHTQTCIVLSISLIPSEIWIKWNPSKVYRDKFLKGNWCFDPCRFKKVFSTWRLLILRYCCLLCFSFRAILIEGEGKMWNLETVLLWCF